MKTHKIITKQGYRALFIIPLLSLSVLYGCKDNSNTIVTPPSDENNLFEALQADANFTTLIELIESASLKPTLTGNMAYTVFAPSNAAFAKLPDGFLEGLTQAQKTEFVRYHFLEDEVRIENDVYNETLESYHGDPIFITVKTSGAKINNSASVTSKNMDVTNGIIHKIDEILIPDEYGTIADNLKKRYEWTGLYEQLEDLDLLNLLEQDAPLSFIVPPIVVVSDIEQWMETDLTDDQLQMMWKYHMVPQDLSGIGPQTSTALQTVMGDSLYLTMNTPGQYLFNTYKLTEMDEKVIKSSNGAIYFLETMMIPDELQGVLTLMEKRFYLTSVRSALAVAKLTGRLYNTDNNADEKFTIFVPRNNSEGLNSMPADQDGLANILKYHVLLEKVTASELQHNQTYTTWQGEELAITRDGDQIIINGIAAIRVADLEGRNGVVHVIDHVLTPVE